MKLIIVGTILCVLYLIALSDYNDKMRLFDRIYTDSFWSSYIQSKHYNDHHAELLKLSEMKSFSSLFDKGNETGFRFFLVNSIQGLDRSYYPIAKCIADNSCIPGWYKWAFCWNANQDRQSILSIFKTLKVDQIAWADPNVIDPKGLWAALDSVCDTEDEFVGENGHLPGHIPGHVH